MIEVKSNKAVGLQLDAVRHHGRRGHVPVHGLHHRHRHDGFGTGKARGVTTDTRSYTLDLSADHAYDIPANTPLTASITYTAVQQ